jgi:CRP-like cAMP-binding protein
MCLDAEQRYAAFLARYPHLETTVAASHIASYLAITPVHLSRLRARRARARPG